MIAARLRIRLPEGTWIDDVSRALPDAEFRLLSGLPTETTAIELGEAITDEPGVVGTAIADHESIVSYREIERGDDRVIARYETTDTGLYELVASSALPVEYPVVAADGWYEFDLTGTREEFDRFRDVLEEWGVPYDLLSIVHGEDATGTVTDRQREVLATALRLGYFEVPRECTLAELAAELEVDKSTASRILRRGQTRIVRWFLTAGDRYPGGPGRQ